MFQSFTINNLHNNVQYESKTEGDLRTTSQSFNPKLYHGKI